GGTTKPYPVLSIPLQFLVDVIDPLHVAVKTGFAAYFDDFGHSFTIPVGFEVGYALGGSEGPLLDINPFFQWPTLFIPGAQTGLDKVQPGYFEAGVSLRAYFYL